MGTPGYIIIKINNKNFVFYNHFDSYVEVLGLLLVENLIKVISENQMEKIKNLFSEIKDDDSEFIIDYKTKELIENVNLQRENKNIIGDLLKKIKENYNNCYYSMDDYFNFTNIEYYYIIDLNKETFSMITHDCILKNIEITIENLEMLIKLVM
jgi:hypothetical protein